MTKAEIMRRLNLTHALGQLGFTESEVDALRRISLTLHRWYELECGDGRGEIVRDETTGKPYWTAEVGSIRTGFRRISTPIADREAGALRRLSKIMAGRLVSFYVQTDPRGAALYILRPGDVPPGADPASYYTRGICVY